MKINKRLCWWISFGHWFKHYQGERSYVRCRLCGRLPASPWGWLKKKKGSHYFGKIRKKRCVRGQLRRRLPKSNFGY